MWIKDCFNPRLISLLQQKKKLLVLEIEVKMKLICLRNIIVNIILSKIKRSMEKNQCVVFSLSIRIYKITNNEKLKTILMSNM